MIAILRRWWRAQFPPEKSVTAWAEIARLPDEPAMYHADGRNKRARVSRYPAPDAAKLAIGRPRNVLPFRQVK